MRPALTRPDRARCLAIAALTMSAACDRAAPASAPEPAPITASQAEIPTIDSEDPRACAPCHGAIVAQWQESMHSQSHHDHDPLYGALRSHRMAREGDALSRQCATCHTPRALDAPDSAPARAGVSCASCHNVAQVHTGPDARGAAALRWEAAGVMRSARDLPAGASPAHGTGAALPAMQDGQTLCLACHGELKNAAGAPTCTTGPEHAARAVGETCVSCHMPQVDGPSGAVSQRATHRSHAFLGAHRAWRQDDVSFLAGAVALEGGFEGARFTLTLHNRSGHGFPSGFPGRMAVVTLRGLDAGGQEVWRNLSANPMKEHPEAVLNKVYHDAEGAPVLPPYGVTLARQPARAG